jgi:methylated-DNA-[protein]-cysteine S-methyltransferase
MTFSDRVKKIVAAIPAGSTMSYKEVATQAGNPRAARAVGTIMRRNFDNAIPCHRVIGSDGGIKSYNRGGERVKRRLLCAEGALS